VRQVSCEQHAARTAVKRRARQPLKVCAVRSPGSSCPIHGMKPRASGGGGPMRAEKCLRSIPQWRSATSANTNPNPRGSRGFRTIGTGRDPRRPTPSSWGWPDRRTESQGGYPRFVHCCKTRRPSHSRRRSTVRTQFDTTMYSRRLRQNLGPCKQSRPCRSMGWMGPQSRPRLSSQSTCVRCSR